ncbi:MAG: hypothetical protein AM326_07305 [Candidatus Thorarchaeota archaeon SMTZ-45]|nr:MAG: hypothetical protein AM325_02790 [Candidatus Thorarchaeota archaeon SMTZ1-45]KXH76305.1 MAG: hypothetical protein AM326_07305 [Candidatus Thorarchaeota archaeon SMTZ-45]
MRMLPPKYVSIAVVIIFIGGLIISILAGQGFIAVDPVMTMGMAILLITILVCCSAITMVTSYSSRIPEFSEMEIRFDEAKSHFDDGEYTAAAEIFKMLAGPRMNHKRALYYGARCYEALGDWENVKIFCKAYLKLKPKDKEVWEMLNRAHKRLFEFEEAQDALDKADSL